MRIIKYILFVLGVVALVSGFLLSRATDIPWILGTLAPDYVSARAGITKLESLDSLSVDDEGFKQLAMQMCNNMSRKNSPEPIDWSLIESIAYKGSQGTYATSLGPVTRMPVDVRMTNGQEVQTDLAPLRKSVQELMSQNFSFWGNLLFGLGILLYVIEFTVSQWKTRKQS